MDGIKIKSNLYDYEVEFIDDFSANLKSFGSKIILVADKKVYGLYKESLADVDDKKIFFMTADEHKKNIETVMEIILFMQNSGVKKDWRIMCIGGGYYSGRHHSRR